MSSSPGVETALVPAPAHSVDLVPATPPVDARSTARVSGGERTAYARERALLSGRTGTVPGPGSERISFTAPCPGCTGDAEWVQIREDTRVRSTVACGCFLDRA